MNKTVGFIGCGNMGSAMMEGMIASQVISSDQLWVSNPHESKFERIKHLNAHTTTDNKEVAKNADFLVLSVKPYMYEKVIAEVKECLKKDVVIVAIAAGKTIAQIKEMVGSDTKVVRLMPNTPAMVQEGMTSVSPDELMTKEDLDAVLELCESFGKAEVVSEKLIDAVIAVSGSSPAYIYMLIEAMADAAVKEGMFRPQAYKFAAQAVLGSAKMVLETGIHPGQLKDNVCSPGGTTIEAVIKLEEAGFRSSVMEAMAVCAQKSKDMSK